MRFWLVISFYHPIIYSAAHPGHTVPYSERMSFENLNYHGQLKHPSEAFPPSLLLSETLKRQRPFKPKGTKSCSECIRGHVSCDRARPSCSNCLRKKKACRYEQDLNLTHPDLSLRALSLSSNEASDGLGSPSTALLALLQPPLSRLPIRLQSYSNNTVISSPDINKS